MAAVGLHTELDTGIGWDSWMKIDSNQMEQSSIEKDRDMGRSCWIVAASVRVHILSASRKVASSLALVWLVQIA